MSPSLSLLAAAKSLQSCLTLCDPTDGSPQGSCVLGILQARTLEWVAISFSNLSTLEVPITCILDYMVLSHMSLIFCYFFQSFSSLVSLSVQFSSVTQSCLTLYNHMDRSTPGLPVHHQLPAFTQTHVHWVGDAIQASHPLSSPSPPAFNLS